MHKNHRRFFAAVLALTTVVSHAQEAINQPDRFGQPVTALGQPATPAGDPTARVPETSQRKVIKNTPEETSELDPDRKKQPGVQGAEFASPPDISNKRPIRPLSEFQKFLFDSTGKYLPIFGSEFFSAAQSTFTPIANSPLPADYALGPGDELLIRGWGSIDIDFRAKIDRNGMITVPTVGSIVLGGVKAGEAQEVIRGAIGRLYKGVTVNVNFGQLRAITVYVVGQAQKPGTYTVSSLSTLVTALFASGGPSPTGSLRRVQVKRAGKVVTELDLYAFIAKGDKSADIKLQDGDSIFIPSAAGYVALVGKVNTPSIYELRTANDTVESLLDFAGGMPVVADPRRAFLERIDPKVNQPRSVEQFALDRAGLARGLRNGDVLNITAITPDFSNAVVLRGNVDQAIRAPFTPGMRISDLIPNRDYLITRSSLQRQNSAVLADESETKKGEITDSIAARVGGLIDEINWDYAVVERINRADLSVSLLPFNLGRVFSQPNGADNILLQPGDTVTIFSQQDVMVPMDKRRVFVRIEGEVNTPGVYQMTSGDTLQTLLARAGGPTGNAYLFGSAFFREQVRKEQAVNLEKLADRLESRLASEQAKSASNVRNISPGDAQVAEARRQAELLAAKQNLERFRRLKPTGRIAFGLLPEERSFSRLPQLKLQNGDRFLVPARPDFVHVFGSVNVEASSLWRPSGRVSDYLKVAGVTSDADVDNIFVMRADGSVVTSDSGKWVFGGIGGLLVMPGDSVVVPEKMDKETAWTKFSQGARDWAQIFANFGLGAAAIRTLNN